MYHMCNMDVLWHLWDNENILAWVDWYWIQNQVSLNYFKILSIFLPSSFILFEYVYSARILSSEINSQNFFQMSLNWSIKWKPIIHLPLGNVQPYFLYNWP